MNSWYRWLLGQDFFKTLKNYGRLPLEMDFDKLMTTMKDKDDMTKERDSMQAQLLQSLEERDLQLLDVLTDSVKEKSSQ